MRMMRWAGLLWLSTALTFLFCVPGCSDGPGDNEASSYFDSHPFDFAHNDITTYSLAITWADAKTQAAGLTVDGQVAVFTGAGGTPPYHWSVFSTSLGAIVDSRGNSAAYRRNVAGDNVVILKDSAGHETYVAVQQPAASHSVIVTNALTVKWQDTTLQAAGLTTNGAFAVFEAAGGTPPYYWDVLTPSLGSIVGGGSSAVYKRTANGDNVVTLKDSVGIDTASTIVHQPAP
jgi:hypothetical protein